MERAPIDDACRASSLQGIYFRGERNKESITIPNPFFAGH